MPRLTPTKISNQGIYGVIRPSEVDDELIPNGAVTEVINFHFDRKGAATVRNGIAALGSTVRHGWPAVGLANAQGGTPVVVFSDSSSATIYSYTGGAWVSSLNEGTANTKVRFVDFGSFTIAINFAGSLRFWGAGANGGSYWKSTGNPINTQQLWSVSTNTQHTPTLGDVFKSRVYLSGDTSTGGNLSRLYFSSVISTAGVISWSPEVDFVDINPGDGENITALKRYQLELLVFKPNNLYRYRRTSVDPDSLIRVGTRSQESIVEGKRGLYFHHDTGFYRYTGGSPDDISRPISDIVTAIPFSRYTNITGWKDTDHIFWSLGNLTIPSTGLSQTWKNVVVRYTESSDVWTVYSLSTDIRRVTEYNSGSTLTRIAGTDYGLVVTLDSGNTDIGEPIEYSLRTKWLTFDSMATRKVIIELVAVCEKAQGMELTYQIDDSDAWKTIGQLKKLVSYFSLLNIQFHRIRFKVNGTKKFEAPVFRFIEILNGVNEGIIKDA